MIPGLKGLSSLKSDLLLLRRCSVGHHLCCVASIDISSDTDKNASSEHRAVIRDCGDCRLLLSTTDHHFDIVRCHIPHSQSTCAWTGSQIVQKGKVNEFTDWKLFETHRHCYFPCTNGNLRLHGLFLYKFHALRTS